MLGGEGLPAPTARAVRAGPLAGSPGGTGLGGGRLPAPTAPLAGGTARGTALEGEWLRAPAVRSAATTAATAAVRAAPAACAACGASLTNRGGGGGMGGLGRLVSETTSSLNASCRPLALPLLEGDKPLSGSAGTGGGFVPGREIALHTAFAGSGGKPEGCCKCCSNCCCCNRCCCKCCCCCSSIKNVRMAM